MDRLIELEREEILTDKQVSELIDIRNEARRQADFEQADKIRDSLNARGFVLIDEKGGRGRAGEVTTWRYLS